MAIINYENLSPAELISHYIIECQGRNLILSYTDYDIINEWLAASSNMDDLLLILSEIIPAHFEKKAETSNFAPNLKGVRKKVLKKLNFIAHRQTLRQPSSEAE